MSKFSKEDAFFMVVVGGKQDAPEPEGSPLLALIAIAIVMMVLVGLFNDADRRRQDFQSPAANCFFSRSVDDIFQPCRRN